MKLFSDGVQDDALDQTRPPSAEPVFRPVGFEDKYDSAISRPFKPKTISQKGMAQEKTTSKLVSGPLTKSKPATASTKDENAQKPLPDNIFVTYKPTKDSNKDQVVEPQLDNSMQSSSSN